MAPPDAPATQVRILSRLAGFRSRSYGTIYSYTPGLCACTSVLVLFRRFLFSPVCQVRLHGGRACPSSVSPK